MRVRTGGSGARARLCPRQRNPHRSSNAWTLHTVRAILGNPRYTGRQLWNRQRIASDLVDPANTGLSPWALRHLQLAPAYPAQIAARVTEHRIGSSPDARGAAGAGRGDKAASGR